MGISVFGTRLAAPHVLGHLSCPSHCGAPSTISNMQDAGLVHQTFWLYAPVGIHPHRETFWIQNGVQFHRRDPRRGGFHGNASRSGGCVMPASTSVFMFWMSLKVTLQLLSLRDAAEFEFVQHQHCCSKLHVEPDVYCK